MHAFIITGGAIRSDCIPERPHSKDSLTVAADAGLENARALGVSVDAVVGDYDSLGHAPDVPDGVEVVTVPKEKDVTDTQLAVEYALRKGATELTIVGGLGGRLDHALANISVLEDLLLHGVRATLSDGQSRVRLLRNDSTILPRSDYTYLSLLSLDPVAKGVEIEGVKYPLKGAKLHRTMGGLGVSNEITGNCCFISVRRGTLLVIESRDF